MQKIPIQYRKSHNTSAICVGILIIGDEILKGLTEDTNTPFLIKSLNELGVKINKVVIVPDDVDAIASEVLHLSDKCTFVLSSGGVGPTHDDVTYEAVAKAFGDDLEINEELSSMVRRYFGKQSDQEMAIRKFASIPKSAVLHFTNFKLGDRKMQFPLIAVKNVYMLPGVPLLLQRSFEVFRNKVMLHSNPLCMKSIFINIDEFSITPILNDAVKTFSGSVKFGSYPTFTDNYYKVKLVLESIEQDSIRKAIDFLCSKLPAGSIVNLQHNLLNTSDKVYILSKTNVKIASSLSILENMLRTYALSELCLCFNGGKDCTALLHLVYSSVQKINPKEWHNIRAVYVRNGESFREVEMFIQSTIKRYDLNLTVMEGDLKEAVNKFLQVNTQIKAMLMGTRRSDPGAAHLTYLSMTDNSWPSVMRILPILDWTYTEVWSFIRTLQLPYCSLYDRGYTSVGLKAQTVRNPLLKYINDKGHEMYKPAYMLEDTDYERDSRL